MTSYFRLYVLNPSILFYTVRTVFAKLLVYMLVIGGPVALAWPDIDNKLKVTVISIIYCLIIVLYVAVCYIAHWSTLKSIEQRKAFSLLTDKEKGKQVGGILE